MKEKSLAELKSELKALDVEIPPRAKKEEIVALCEENDIELTKDDAVVSDDLLKLIEEKGGYAFDSKELQEELKADKEAEYPDFGRDIPDGEYIITGYSTVHDWKSKKTGNISHIRTAFIRDDADNLYELPFAAMCAKEWDFIQFNGKDSDGKILYKKIEFNSMLPFYSSIADRNLAVTQKISAGTRVKIAHARGHFDNPYNTGKIFDFLLTWAELA